MSTGSAQTNTAAPDDNRRDNDPGLPQRRAADPEVSAWVGASAGTGKTKVLTDRVLRLLLPRADGTPGTAAQRILCLTFTKAGASEMAVRISKKLGDWAVMDDGKLAAELEALTGRTASIQDRQAARRLFAAVVDTPGGLKIMTIHSFCQSVLARFPLEAGITPHGAVIDDSPARRLREQARDLVLARGKTAPDSALGRALINLAARQNEEQFTKLLDMLCGERAQLMRATEDPDSLHERLCTLLGIAPEDSEQSVREQACRSESFNESGLWQACRALATGSEKTDQPKGIGIQAWLEQDVKGRMESYDEYKALFLTQKNQPRKTLLTKAPAERDPAAAEYLAEEALRLAGLEQYLCAVRCAGLSHDLLLTGRAVLEQYDRMKQSRAALDYDDLIEKTKMLLTQDGAAPWVLYKLDGGLDHILVDEAQDTNPEQWDIIKALSGDFFAGEGVERGGTGSRGSHGGNGSYGGGPRTIFTVGDEKQSIYSFQRAAPREFQIMHDYFEKAVKGAREVWRDEALVTSFRSVSSVLRLVDQVFEAPAVRQGLGRDILPHISYRDGQAGLAELWPLCQPDDSAPEEPWTPPTAIIDRQSGALKLAEKIGEQIKDWMENGETLESHGRAVRPGDIMILLRTRTAFVNQLVRALKKRAIPVSGIDRMVLGEQIVVMDLLAAASFALLPDDDLTLACLLKSPFIGWDEDQLYDACHGRAPQTLWQRLKTRGDTQDRAVITWLEDLRASAGRDHPYEFFSRILQRSCPADEKGGLLAIVKRLGQDAIDPLDEFLASALNYERDNIPALQGFLAWQKREDMTIKRELEEAGDCVRIMTVHGAKGLQAPIVFLPDTVRTPGGKATPRLLWPDKTGLDLPLWSPREDCDPPLYQEAFGRLKTQLDEESRRLLYVAMTRAEDRLYIGGYVGGKNPADDSWYYYIADAFKALPDTQKTGPAGEEILRITNPQSAAPDRTPEVPGDIQSGTLLPPPDWLFAPPQPEPHPPRPLAPSRPSGPAPAARSPRERDEDGYRFRRGTITHKLLQILPDLPPAARREAAQLYTGHNGHDLPPSVQAGIVDETLAILEHPDFAPLFGPGSQAEVPVTGLVGDKLVSGEIDRLLVEEDRLWIIDYKTNRPPPEKEQDIPAQYRAQLQAYRDTLALIYPGRAIRCFLLWTDGPRLMEVMV